MQQNSNTFFRNSFINFTGDQTETRTPSFLVPHIINNKSANGQNPQKYKWALRNQVNHQLRVNQDRKKLTANSGGKIYQTIQKGNQGFQKYTGSEGRKELIIIKRLIKSHGKQVSAKQNMRQTMILRQIGPETTKLDIEKTPRVKFSQIENRVGQLISEDSLKKLPEWDKKNLNGLRTAQKLQQFIAKLNQSSIIADVKDLNHKKQQQHKKTQHLKIPTNNPHFNSLQQIIMHKYRKNQSSQLQQVNGFQIVKLLGRGRFGQVYLARHIETGFLAALKKFSKAKLKEVHMVDQFVKEIRLQNCLQSPKVVKFYGYFEEGDKIYLVMEYVNGGTLFDYLNQVGKLQVKEAVQFLRDIIEAVVYLHDRSIVHRDIKPQNIVVSNEGVAKLCDFGWSAIIETSRRTYCGTLQYAPPEMIQRKNYNLSVDIWCLGVLTYQLLVGRAPFESEQRLQVMERIVNVDRSGLTYPQDIPDEARQFIDSLMQKDASKRPKCCQLLNYKLFQVGSRGKSKRAQI